MNYQIVNPKEDQYGNSKENIFLAFQEDGGYLGSAYAYPSVNYYQTYETPYLIFIGVNMAPGMDSSVLGQVRQELFDRVLARAKELRGIRMELKARIYSGFEHDEAVLNFYVGNGFEEDYSIMMEANIPTDFCYKLPEHIKAIDCLFDTEEAFAEYKKRYDEIFVSPLDRDALLEQSQQKHFKNLSFIFEGRLQGGCTIFEKDGFGYIETLYVVPEALGNGVSKVMMNYIFDYFAAHKLGQSRLEVWHSNKRAVELYKGFGYRETKRNLMFPGITL